VAKIGRPSLLTPKIQEKICELLRTGAPLETCADAVGVWPQTLSDWQRRARECVDAHSGDVTSAKADEKAGVYVEFTEAISRARAEAELALLEKVKAAGKGGWAAGWILERVMRRRYHTRAAHEVEVSGTIGGGEGADADAAAKARALAFLAGAAGRAKDKGDPGTEE